MGGTYRNNNGTIENLSGGNIVDAALDKTSDHAISNAATATKFEEIDDAIGDTDISDIGDGTVTGAVSQLNSDLSGKVNTSDIINNLTSVDINKPLSAAQGKSLKDSMSGIGNYYTREKKFATSGATTLTYTFTNIPNGVHIGHLYFYGFAGTEGGFLNIYTGAPNNCTCIFCAWAGDGTREMSVPINIVCPKGNGSLPVSLYIGGSWQGTANIGLGLHLTKVGNIS